MSLWNCMIGKKDSKSFYSKAGGGGGKVARKPNSLYKWQFPLTHSKKFKLIQLSLAPVKENAFNNSTLLVAVTNNTRGKKPELFLNALPRPFLVNHSQCKTETERNLNYHRRQQHKKETPFFGHPVNLANIPFLS